jgi:alkylation response protein AidB-like acyl-CoA dehydrogenase
MEEWREAGIVIVAARAKLMCSELQVEMADLGVQLHGGAVYQATVLPSIHVIFKSE